MFEGVANKRTVVFIGEGLDTSAADGPAHRRGDHAPVAKDRIPEVLGAISARVRGFTVPPPEASEAPPAKRGGLFSALMPAQGQLERSGARDRRCPVRRDRCRRREMQGGEVRRHGVGAAGAEHAAGRPHRASDDRDRRASSTSTPALPACRSAATRAHPAPPRPAPGRPASRCASASPTARRSTIPIATMSAA